MANGKRLQRKARGERPYFFDDPSVDKVVAMVMGLAGEVAVARDRLDTLERLLERKGLVKLSEIELYAPSPGVMAERAAWRETFLSEVLRIIEIELEAETLGDNQPYDEAIANVEAGTQPGHDHGTPVRKAAKPRKKKAKKTSRKVAKKRARKRA